MVSDLSIASVTCSSDYYCYLLKYPKGKVFYVGKGYRNRIFYHEDQAKEGVNTDKCAVIRSIWEKGGEVGKEIVYRTPDERNSFQYEWFLIYLVYGIENLTNVESRYLDSSYVKHSLFAQIREDACLSITELATLAMVPAYVIYELERRNAPVSVANAQRLIDALKGRFKWSERSPDDIEKSLVIDELIQDDISSDGQIKIRDLREECGLSIRELAQLAGVSNYTVARLERDEQDYSLSTVKKILKVINLRLGRNIKPEEVFGFYRVIVRASKR